MMVRMTTQQLNQVLAAVDSSPMSTEQKQSMGDWLTRMKTPAGRSKVDVTAPTIAWSRLEDHMFDLVFDNRGYRRSKVRSTLVSAHRQIVTSLNIRKTHPALKNVGAQGLVSEIIPAWKIGHKVNGFSYTALPDRSLQFVLLGPTFIEANGHRITKWVEMGQQLDRPLYREESHLLFV